MGAVAGHQMLVGEGGGRGSLDHASIHRPLDVYRLGMHGHLERVLHFNLHLEARPQVGEGRRAQAEGLARAEGEGGVRIDGDGPGGAGIGADQQPARSLIHAVDMAFGRPARQGVGAVPHAHGPEAAIGLHAQRHQRVLACGQARQAAHGLGIRIEEPAAPIHIHREVVPAVGVQHEAGGAHGGDGAATVAEGHLGHAHHAVGVGAVLHLEVHDPGAVRQLHQEQRMPEVEVELHGVVAAGRHHQVQAQPHLDRGARHAHQVAGYRTAVGLHQVHAGGIDGDAQGVIGAHGDLGRGEQLAHAVEIHEVDLGGGTLEGHDLLGMVGLVQQGHLGDDHLDGRPLVRGGVREDDRGRAHGGGGRSRGGATGGTSTAGQTKRQGAEAEGKRRQGETSKRRTHGISKGVESRLREGEENGYPTDPPPRRRVEAV